MEQNSEFEILKVYKIRCKDQKTRVGASDVQFLNRIMNFENTGLETLTQQ